MSDILNEATKRLAGAGIENPRREARIMLGYVLGVPSNTLLVSSPKTDARDLQRFNALVSRRAAHEPLAYITGQREFWSIPLRVAPGVLIPRPETETLIECLRKALPDNGAPLSILDLGTGSGCLLIAALQEYPRSRGLGIDASDAALAIARHNVGALALAKRGELKKADFGDATGSFDVILSNPPYIPSGDIAGLEVDVRDFEPRAALDGGPDGLDAYRQLAGLLPHILAKGGWVFLEIGQGQADSVAMLMRAQGLKVAEIAADLAGIPRCLVLRAP